MFITAAQYDALTSSGLLGGVTYLLERFSAMCALEPDAAAEWARGAGHGLGALSIVCPFSSVVTREWLENMADAAAFSSGVLSCERASRRAAETPACGRFPTDEEAVREHAEWLARHAPAFDDDAANHDELVRELEGQLFTR